MRTSTLLGAAGLLGLALALASVARAQDVEAVHQLPGGDRFYRVLLPGASETVRGAPLVVYLHPSSDGRFEEFQRDYWPMLRERKCVVAMPRGKGKYSWLAGEDVYIRNVIDDAQKRYSTDPQRVILLGISGGGQVALLLADREPQRFRAMILVSTNPVSVRGDEAVWFYPNHDTLKQCPYFVIHHITQGSALMYWRQVRAKLEGDGASISILPVMGPVSQYLPPPPELPIWLDEVLAGRNPAPLSDPQQAAVAAMFRQAVADLGKALASGPAAAVGGAAVKDGPTFRLGLPLPAGFTRGKKEDASDASGSPITQIRIEHEKLPIYVRCDARATALPMPQVLAAEQKDTAQRGMLYQVYQDRAVSAGPRQWRLQVGSTTYPDRARGWTSTLFLHAVSPVDKDPKQWLEVLVMDETQKPDAAELAGVLRAILAGVTAEPAAPMREEHQEPATQPSPN